MRSAGAWESRNALATPVEPPTQNIDRVHMHMRVLTLLDSTTNWLSSLAKQFELLKKLVHTGVASVLCAWDCPLRHFLEEQRPTEEAINNESIEFIMPRLSAWIIRRDWAIIQYL